jgi:hypothetical protein
MPRKLGVIALVVLSSALMLPSAPASVRQAGPSSETRLAELLVYTQKLRAALLAQNRALVRLNGRISQLHARVRLLEQSQLSVVSKTGNPVAVGGGNGVAVVKSLPCASGQVAIGGSFVSERMVNLVASQPSTDNGWEIGVVNPTPASTTVTVRAICLTSLAEASRAT